MTANRRQVLEAWLICLISAHSVAVAVFLLFFPEWSASFGGWGVVNPVFFARQAGVFHFVVAVGYLYEYFRYRGVVLLVVAKTTAVVFLLGAAVAMDELAWAVPVSAVADGVMAAAVVLVRRWASERSR